MKRAEIALKLIAPVAFFGYAAYANLDLLREGDLAIAERDLLQGGVTEEIDSLYRDRLPHRQPSIGLVGALRYTLLGEGRDGVVVGRDNWLFTVEEYRFSGTGAVPMRETVARMAEMRETLAAAGSALVVVPLPAKVDIERSYGTDPDISLRSSREYRDFLTALKEAGLVAVDTRGVYEEAADGAKFFRTDTHWTPQTAESVARHIAATRLVAGGDRTYEKRLAPPEIFHGDLVSFVTNDMLAPVVGLVPEQAFPFVAIETGPETGGSTGGDTLDLFGGVEADVVLVGTSYSANTLWSFAEALKIALGRDVLNYAAEGQGPVRPMEEFLASLRAGETPPEVVLWEFPIRYLADPALWRTEAEDGAQDA